MTHLIDVETFSKTFLLSKHTCLRMVTKGRLLLDPNFKDISSVRRRIFKADCNVLGSQPKLERCICSKSGFACSRPKSVVPTLVSFYADRYKCCDYPPQLYTWRVNFLLITLCFWDIGNFCFKMPINCMKISKSKIF